MPVHTYKYDDRENKYWYKNDEIHYNSNLPVVEWFNSERHRNADLSAEEYVNGIPYLSIIYIINIKVMKIKIMKMYTPIFIIEYFIFYY